MYPGLLGRKVKSLAWTQAGWAWIMTACTPSYFSYILSVLYIYMVYINISAYIGCCFPYQDLACQHKLNKQRSIKSERISVCDCMQKCPWPWERVVVAVAPLRGPHRIHFPCTVPIRPNLKAKRQYRVGEEPEEPENSTACMKHTAASCTHGTSALILHEALPLADDKK